MDDLRSLKLEAVYDSSEYHLVNDLMVPLLSKSKVYCRGVGYFSSGWLRIAASGLGSLISNGGTARLIMSPILESKDWQAIVLGQNARDDDVLRKSLLSSISEISTSLEKDTLNTFAWLIADGLLDIRFAVPRADHAGGDYHDKVAYFVDTNGSSVAIHGSYNDSIKGTLNGEAFSVFRSWDIGQLPFIEKHISRLNNLWEDNNSQFHSFKLPEAIRQSIVKLRNSDRPYELPNSDGVSEFQNRLPCLPKKYDLRGYQQDAIAAWKKNGCHGILEMATGAGKTFTALSASAGELEDRAKLAVVIIVPFIHLLDQWNDDCVAFGFRPVLCGSSQNKWKAKLRSAITDFRLTVPDLCIIAVHKTACGESFIDALSKIPAKQKMLIADEVHGLGSSQLQNALRNDYDMRLGLSATPTRWYDELGTQVLMNYFKDVCFEFTLKDAIEKDFLVNYRYEPQLIHLSESEEIIISELSGLIGRLSGKKSSTGLDEVEQQALEKALRERALIVKKAENKLGGLRDLIVGLRSCGENFDHSLFYSPESQHKEVLQVLKSEGILAHQFIGEDSAKDRQKVLADFDKGRITSLVAMKCLDEGVDVPATKTAFFIASTTNPKEFIQRRGRVLRKASGKNRANIYDFIVVPSKDTSEAVAHYLLEREMPRFAEFSDLAENRFEARKLLRPLLDQYEMLHLLDLKPWDIYHRQNPQARDEQ